MIDEIEVTSDYGKRIRRFFSEDLLIVPGVGVIERQADGIILLPWHQIMSIKADSLEAIQKSLSLVR